MDRLIECFTTTFLHAHYWLNWVTDGQTDRQTDGHANLIVGLVTRNPPKKERILYQLLNMNIQCIRNIIRSM